MRLNRALLSAITMLAVIGIAPPLFAADLQVTGTISGTPPPYDSPEGIVFNAATIAAGARVTAVSTYEVHLTPGTRIADGARLSVTMRDNDGLSNRCEMQYFLNLTHNPNVDDDTDGLSNLQECQAGTSNPNNPDTDEDGIPDNCETPFDTTAPTITLLGSNPTNLCHGVSYNDAGATASDTCLGNITSGIVVVNPVNTNVSGTYLVTYNVQDHAGNRAVQATRTVVVDMESPAITLKGENPLILCIGSAFQDPGATANDNCDGDITSRLVVTNPVNTSQAGNYTVTYNVSDSAGNHAQPVTRTVVVMGSDQTVQINTTYQYDEIGRLRSISRQVQ